MLSTSLLAQNVARLSALTVLVVDDDYCIRGLWKHMLSNRIPGVLAMDAADGVQALQLAHELQPDLIIMDVAMPGLDGFQATRRLKEDTATSKIPVLAVTGKVFSSEDALAAGCDGYLLKPISEDQLLGEIARLLGGRLQ